MISFGQNVFNGPGALLFHKNAQGVPNTNPLPAQTNRDAGNGVGVASAGGMQAEALPRYTVGGPAQFRPDNDISQAGTNERAFGQHGGDWLMPGPAQQFNQQHGADFLAPTANEQLYQQQQAAGPMVNNAQHEYNQFHAPNIAAEPGFGSYYDNAQKNTINALNTQLGARGAYGSSVGLGQIGKSVTDLRADQAQHEADYNLRRLTEQRGWSQLGGELARGADASARSNQDVMSNLASNASNSRQTGLTQAGNAAQAAGLERNTGLTGYFNAAQNAQIARENRADMGLNARIKSAGGLGALIGGAYDNFLEGDQQLMGGGFTGGLGGAREQLNYQSQNSPGNQLLQLANTYNTFRPPPTPTTNNNYYGYGGGYGY